ncbi:MAG TPA: hypothetical protein VGM90_27495 [Kofleriaceae bacterium]|jgi:hypothetical protein
MQRLALIAPLFASLLVASACHKGGGETTTPSDQPPPLAKHISIAWGIQKGDKGTDLYLALTDEVGKVQSHPLGTYPGACDVTTAAKTMNALTALRCMDGATGTELHAVTQGGDKIIVLKLRVDEGVTPDPMDRAEVATINVPLGVGISVDPVQATTGAPGQ